MKSNLTSIKYGIITGIFLIGYFALLGALGYINSPIYSLFNALICALGIFMAISEKGANVEDFSYKMGFKTGVKTGIIATIIFTIFFGVFVTVREGSFLLPSQLDFITTNYFLLLLVVGLMGVLSVFVVTYILMHYFKKSWDLA
ncbi:MAG TPA: hypothetical protein VK021_12135 [Flavobacteriaceae bacterium]|nr:hypothetical protein [Flavobacteriaceae bacterium]